MASERLQVILEMVSGQYQSQARQAARATSEIAESGSKVNQTMGQVEQKMTAFGKAAVAGLGIAAVAAFKDTARAASDLQESVNAVNQVFEGAADKVLAYGQVAAQVSGLAASEFNALAVNTGALLTNLGFSFDDAGDEAIRLTTRAADMASVFNVDVSVALNAINSGLQGQSRPLRQFGVNLTDAAIRAKAVEMGLAATTAEVDANGKAVASLELIYEQTAKTQGDFIRTSDEAANAQRILAAEFENAKATFGESTLGAKTFFMAATSDLLAGINLTGIFGKNAKEAQIQAFRFEEAVQAVTQAIKDQEDPLSALAEGLLHIARDGDLTVAQFEALAGAAGLSSDQFGDFGRIVLEMGEAMGLPQEILDELAAAILGTGDAASDTGPEIEDLGKEALTAAERMQLLADNQRAATRAFQDALNPISNAFSALERLNTAEERLIELQESGEASARDIAEAQFEWVQSLYDAQGALEAIDPSALEGTIEAIGLAFGWSDDEARAFLETLGLLDGKTVTTVINTTYRTTRDAGSMTANDSFGGPRAHGGPVQAGMTYLVGERGPEMIVPSQSGYVIPNDMLSGMGGTSNWTIIVPDTQSASHVESLIRQNHSLTRGGLKGGTSR